MKSDYSETTAGSNFDLDTIGTFKINHMNSAQKIIINNQGGSLLKKTTLNYHRALWIIIFTKNSVKQNLN